MAEFLEIEATGPDSAWSGRACEVLAGGGIVVHPTSAVYGMGGAGRKADAEVARLKGRPASTPTIRLVRGVTAVRRHWPGAIWTRDADRLAAAFWPGPLTLVLDDGTDMGLAVRAERHPVVQRLLELCEATIGSTSVNRSGGAPAATLADVRRVLDAMPISPLPILLLAVGDLPGPPASTLLSLRSGMTRLLREGAIPATEMEAILGRPIDG